MQQKTIMIVEDEGLIANDIAGQLRSSGYEVSAISSSGEEALSLLQSSTPDLVLMDIRLKGRMDGIEAASRVRSEYGLPVIFLTSHADSETLARAKQTEPFGYLVKPFRQLNLCSAIEMALYKHQSERTLIEREAWLTTVLQSTADPTVVTDVGGRIQFLNSCAERLLDCALSGVVGMNWTEVVPLYRENSGEEVEDLGTVASMQMATLKLPRGIVLRKRDGSEVPVEGEVAPSILRGNIAGSVITIRDVSERSKEEADVRHEQKMLAVGRLAGGVAHDFNNLLTVIIGHGSQLAASLSNAGDIARLQAVLDAAHTAGEITQQLLTLGRKQVLATELLDVNDCVRRLARLVNPIFPAGVELRTDLAGMAGKVRMNAAHLDQVLLNLILNARDAMHDGGTIVVSTEPLNRGALQASGEFIEEFVSIKVTDAGSGISAEVREHLFEPFFTTKPPGKGTGLGLAIVYGIVKDAGGEISVQSVPGGGTCFEVLIPRVDEGARRPTEGGMAQVPDAPRPTTILLVDDQDAIRTLIHNYFEQQGFRLIQARDGQEALDLAEMYEGQIDLLISDILMPRMDGPTLSSRLSDSRPAMKVLFISGHPGAAVESLRRPGRSSAFLQKPFALPNLLKKVQELTAA